MIEVPSARSAKKPLGPIVGLVLVFVLLEIILPADFDTVEVDAR